MLLRATFFKTLVGGAGVWAIGRAAIHIGTSGLVFGYFGIPGSQGMVRAEEIGSILVAIAVIFLYGGLILGVVPARGLVSWEAHLFGMTEVMVARTHSR